MPYKSQAQERYFNANRAKLQSQGVNVNEWNQSSKGLKLPKRAKSSKASGQASHKKMKPAYKKEYSKFKSKLGLTNKETKPGDLMKKFNTDGFAKKKTKKKVTESKNETLSQEKKESPSFEKAENKKGIELAMKRKKKEKSKNKSNGKKK